MESLSSGPISKKEIDRDTRKYISGLSLISISLVLILVFMSVFFLSVLSIFTIIGFWSNAMDIMIILGQMSSFLPLLSLNFLLIIPLIGIFSLVKPAKNIKQIDEWKVKRAGTMLLLSILTPGFIFFIFLVIIWRTNPADISGFLMGVLVSVNILTAFLFFYAFIYPIQDLLDERRRDRSNLIIALWMVPSIVFAFDGAFMMSKVFLPAPQFTIARAMFYLLMYVVMCVPLGMMIGLYSWTIKRMQGRERPSEPPKQTPGSGLKRSRIPWKFHPKPRYQAIAVFILSFGLGVLNGFVGELDPIHFDIGGIGGRKDPYEEFEDHGIIDGDWFEDHLNEGEEKQWVFYIDSDLYYVFVELIWEDEGDYIRWVNTPDEFQLAVEIYQDSELIDSDTANSEDGYIEVEIDRETDPVFVTRMVVTITLIDAGDYEKRIGPGIFEELKDEGNDITMDLVFAYLWNKSWDEW